MNNKKKNKGYYRRRKEFRTRVAIILALMMLLLGVMCMCSLPGDGPISSYTDKIKDRPPTTDKIKDRPRLSCGDGVYIEHTVKSGETLWVICRKFYGYEVDVRKKIDEVCRENGIRNQNEVGAGRVILLKVEK